MKIPVIDIFAGPGGLGEGFSSFYNRHCNQNHFKIVLSIEKDKYAHNTLTLRSFFRQFPTGEIPIDYYEFVKGNISLEELFNRWPEQAERAKNESWMAELGENKNSVPNKLVDIKIRNALEGNKNWLLIGGPPCQAYSVAGRSRRQVKILDEKKDKRVGLYKHYLRILAVHNPAVFVMENVKGLLSANTKHSLVFSKMLSDLSNPVNAYYSEFGGNDIKLKCPGYKIYSLVTKPSGFDSNGNPVFCHKDFIICSEKFGIPQTRHRVILLGIRNDIDYHPNILAPQPAVPISLVLSGLPSLRSMLSKSKDNIKTWKAAILKILEKNIIDGVESDVKQEIIKQIKKISLHENEVGGEYISYKKTDILYRPAWYLDNKLEGVCNHASRGHMGSDLLRYFFASCFAKVKNRSPKLSDFPESLLPAHKNVNEGVNDKKFADRFRVQLWNAPAKTITSHISKDGHYYIHPDPSQCRSLTVREAARIQTFPDNYYFCGPRTSQFVQVGNAVPPLLAKQIAEIVFGIFKELYSNSKKLNTNDIVSVAV
jgi:DNA (cytosine-5)-methyltransferase 1